MARTFPLAVIISAVDRFSGPLGRMGGKAGEFGKRLTKIGRDLSLSVTLPLAGLAAAAVRSGTAFQTSLNEVEAATGASAEQMAAFRSQVEAMGAGTHTLQETATAAAMLAREGEDLLSIQQETRPALLLAAAAHLELSEAVSTLDGTLDAFGLSGDQALRVVDRLAKAGQTTNLAGLTEGLQAVGPRARATGQDLENTIALLDALEDAGMGAAEGGSALDQVLKSLSKPSAAALRTFARLKIRPEDLRDANGELIELVDLLDLIAAHGGDARHALAIFQRAGGVAMANLLANGTDAIRAQAAALEEADGAAEGFVKVLRSGGVDSTIKFADAWQRLTTSLAESGILDMLARAAGVVGDLARKFQALPPGTRSTIVTFGAIAAAVGPLIVGLGAVVSSISSIVAAAIVAGPAILAGLPFAVIAAAIGAVVFAGVQLVRHWDVVVWAAERAWGKIKSAVGGALDWVAGKIQAAANLAPNWLVDLLGGGATPAAAGGPRVDRPAEITGAPMAQGRMDALEQGAASAQRTEVGGRINVDFRNAPPGTRFRTERRGPVELDASAGFNLAGAL